MSGRVASVELASSPSIQYGSTLPITFTFSLYHFVVWWIQFLHIIRRISGNGTLIHFLELSRCAMICLLYYPFMMAATSVPSQMIHGKPLIRKLFLNILRISQQSTCAGDSSFNKVGSQKPATLFKMGLRYRCFSVNCTKS